MPAIGLRWRHNTVRTLAAGIVASEGKLRGYGHAIIVDHGHGWHTFYSHLSKVRVKKGQAVAAGDILGRSAKKSFLLFSYLGKPVDPHKILKQPHGQPYHQALREKTWHAAHRFSSERARQGNGLGIG
ncbi:MAG: M23 family metallopeptidase [Turneriella sp.]|nr:M23 family metallopeptidase [Leptospiraceae bacterium]MCX7632027.1 M23 family metallopeptidase [Turneriella sp.]